jgi:cytochrome oxidase Cu insertion factor (SCO1/SenC/PrrC family)
MSASTKVRRRTGAAERRRLAQRRQRRRRLALLGLIGGAAALAVVIAMVVRRPVPSADVAGSPEPSARIGTTAVDVGAPFPAFSLTDADGQKVTNAALVGKPSIVWFTTSYCVPCQVGARVVAGLDDELGGDAFNVLVLFVDPAEPPSALLDWRSRFGRDDWIVALDTAVATQVGLRFLDTKFLLDGNGIIQDIDLQIADQRYVELVRELVRREVRGAS